MDDEPRETLTTWISLDVLCWATIPLTAELKDQTAKEQWFSDTREALLTAYRAQARCEVALVVQALRNRFNLWQDFAEEKTAALRALLAQGLRPDAQQCIAEVLKKWVTVCSCAPPFTRLKAETKKLEWLKKEIEHAIQDFLSRASN